MISEVLWLNQRITDLLSNFDLAVGANIDSTSLGFTTAVYQSAENNAMSMMARLLEKINQLEIRSKTAESDHEAMEARFRQTLDVVESDRKAIEARFRQKLDE